MRIPLSAGKVAVYELPRMLAFVNGTRRWSLLTECVALPMRTSTNLELAMSTFTVSLPPTLRDVGEDETVGRFAVEPSVLKR